MSDFPQKIAMFRSLLAQGYDAGPLIEQLLATATTDDMAEFCLPFGYNVRDYLADCIRQLVNGNQPPTAAEPTATSYASIASSSSSTSSSSASSSSASSAKLEERWGDMIDAKEQKDECRKDVKEQKAHGGKGNVRGRGRKDNIRGRGRGTKGNGRGPKSKEVESAHVHASSKTPTTACAHMVLGGRACTYHERGICTFLHEGIVQESGQPTGWFEKTLGTWTGQHDALFGISVATSAVVRWSEEEGVYEESSTEAFREYLAARDTDWKAKHS